MMLHKISLKRFNIMCLLFGHDWKRSGLVYQNDKLKTRMVCSRCREKEYR